METKEKEFKGLVVNGFVALLLLLALAGLSVYGLIYFVNHEMILGVVLCIIAALFFLISLTGLRMQEPNEAMAMLFFGNYKGTFRKTGFYWVNFLYSSKRVSLRARNLNVDPIKVLLGSRRWLIVPFPQRKDKRLDSLQSFLCRGRCVRH